jgi:hypothetical protein
MNLAQHCKVHGLNTSATGGCFNDNIKLIYLHKSPLGWGKELLGLMLLLF